MYTHFINFFSNSSFYEQYRIVPKNVGGSHEMFIKFFMSFRPNAESNIKFGYSQQQLSANPASALDGNCFWRGNSRMSYFSKCIFSKLRA